MNFLYGLRKYWMEKIKFFCYWIVFLLPLFSQMIEANEFIDAEGILFKADLQCALVAPNRRIKVAIPPQLLLLPDSLICISKKYPAFLWIGENAEWQNLIGKHVRVTGSVREFFPGEFLIEAKQIIECEPMAKKNQVQTNLTEDEICYWEDQIPFMAIAALRQEGVRALFKGFDVIQSHDNALWTVHPDGTETFIKELPPYVPAETRHILDNIRQR